VVLGLDVCRFRLYNSVAVSHNQPKGNTKEMPYERESYFHGFG
jgi:hypothetical protein